MRHADSGRKPNRTFAAPSAETCLKSSTQAGTAERAGPSQRRRAEVAVAERRCSSEALDHSGVWRFREVLPILESFGNAVTLREGNTPLYQLPRASKALGSTSSTPSTRE